MTTQRTRIPSIGQRGRTFGGEFEVVSQDSKSAVIRWLDDDTTTRMDREVLELMLASYSNAMTLERVEQAQEPVAVDSMLPGWMLDQLIAQANSDADTRACFNCSGVGPAGETCFLCGDAECGNCEACSCLVTADIETGVAFPRQ